MSLSDRIASLLALLAVIATALVYAYALGADSQVKLASEARQAAHKAQYIAALANYRMSERLGVSEKAIRVCLYKVDDDLRKLIEDRLADGSFPR